LSLAVAGEVNWR